MTKIRTAVAVVALLCVAAVAHAQGLTRVLWFSQRMIVLDGHPLVDAEGRQLPGPIVAYFVVDGSNRATCVMIMIDQRTGQPLPPVSVDAGSCNLR